MARRSPKRYLPYMQLLSCLSVKVLGPRLSRGVYVKKLIAGVTRSHQGMSPYVALHALVKKGILRKIRDESYPTYSITSHGKSVLKHTLNELTAITKASKKILED